jgi:hypothetical protein
VDGPIRSPDFDDVELVEPLAVDLGVERRGHPANTGEGGKWEKGKHVATRRKRSRRSKNEGRRRARAPYLAERRLPREELVRVEHPRSRGVRRGGEGPSGRGVLVAEVWV